MAMSQVAPPAPNAHLAPISIARLHGEACIRCGAVHRKLYPAGEVTVAINGRHRVWPVAACEEHRGGAR